MIKILVNMEPIKEYASWADISDSSDDERPAIQSYSSSVSSIPSRTSSAARSPVIVVARLQTPTQSSISSPSAAHTQSPNIHTQSRHPEEKEIINHITSFIDDKPIDARSIGLALLLLHQQGYVKVTDNQMKRFAPHAAGIYMKIVKTFDSMDVRYQFWQNIIRGICVYYDGRILSNTLKKKILDDAMAAQQVSSVEGSIQAFKDVKKIVTDYKDDISFE